MEAPANERKGKRFVWGLVLAWIPFLVFIGPMIYAFLSVFRGLSEQKATGVGAVAGGFTEALATFGFVALLMSQVAAITFLVRSFSKANPVRSLFSVLSIFCSGLIIGTMGICAWLFLIHAPH